MFIRAEKVFINETVSIFVGTRTHELKPSQLQEVAAGRHREPTLELGATEAQQLMDDLFACGIRPSEAAGTAGQLTAVTAHLQGMRTPCI